MDVCMTLCYIGEDICVCTCMHVSYALHEKVCKYVHRSVCIHVWNITYICSIRVSGLYSTVYWTYILIYTEYHLYKVVS